MDNLTYCNFVFVHLNHLLTSINLLETTDGTYLVLYAAADAFFYFLPVILGFSAGVKFKANPYMCAAIGAALLYPDIVALKDAGTAITFLKLPVVLYSYGNSVFPIMVSAWVASKIEHAVQEKLPAAIRNFFVPLITMIIVIPLSFLVIGPVFTQISNLLASGTSAIYSFSPVLSGILLGAFWQLVVIFGLHYAFIPILINNITTMGKDPINAILSVTVFALAGAALGFAVKVKNKEKKALGFSACVTGLLGITEPIIYGVALPYRKPFAMAFIGGGIAGAITAAMGTCMYGFGGGGVFAAPMFLNPAGADISIVAYGISSAVAFIVSGVLTFLVMKKDIK